LTTKLSRLLPNQSSHKKLLL